MSPRCEVPQLNEIALTVVAKQLIDTLIHLEINEDITLTFAIVTSYYETLGATADIYQDLLNLILNSDYLEPSARFFALRLLLKDNVKILATGIFPCPYYDKILRLIIEQGQGLTALNLKGVWVKEEHLDLMYKLIKTLRNLTVLNIPYIANDEILKFVGEFCSGLKMIDVSGESDITEIGIDSLLNSSPQIKETLSVVNIGTYGEENICHTDVALLIANLPNLINLGSYSFVGKSLLYILESPEYSNTFKSKLQYIHDVHTDVPTIKAITQTCPTAETLYIEEPAPNVLLQIKEMKQLSRLKLNKFQCHELHQLLDKIGTQIHSLMLLQAKGSFNLTRIAEQCKNVTMIECYQMDVITHEEEKPFEKLQHIEILHSTVNTSSLKYLLIASPELKKIIIGDEVRMDDDDIARLLRKHEFKNLEGVWFPNAPKLTKNSVELMMETCPKLQSLGQLSGWSFTPDDMMLLRAIIASTNTDLVLSPLGLFP